MSGTNPFVSRYLQIRGTALARGDRGLEREANLQLIHQIGRGLPPINTVAELDGHLTRLGYLSAPVATDPEADEPKRRGRPPKEHAVAFETPERVVEE